MDFKLVLEKLILFNEFDSLRFQVMIVSAGFYGVGDTKMGHTNFRTILEKKYGPLLVFFIPDIMGNIFN